MNNSGYVGVVDPRLAAETVSVSYLHCILKGLHKSARVAAELATLNHPGVITAGKQDRMTDGAGTDVGIAAAESRRTG